jgi:hypothetical protein
MARLRCLLREVLNLRNGFQDADRVCLQAVPIDEVFRLPKVVVAAVQWGNDGRVRDIGLQQDPALRPPATPAKSFGNLFSSRPGDAIGLAGCGAGRLASVQVIKGRPR